MREKENNFRTQYDRCQIRSHPGTREKVVYTPQFDRHGHFELVESGKENLYEFIQSFKESVDINVILKRFANGDASALARRQGTYGDFTGMPNSYAEMLNRLTQAEDFFNSLPVETRAEFNHNFGEFVAQLDNAEMLTKVGLIKPVSDPVSNSVPDGGAPVE